MTSCQGCLKNPAPPKKTKKEAEEIHLIAKQWVTMIHVMKL